MLAKVKNKDTESVISALIKQSKKLPSELYKSLTWDRGHELADHQRFTLATDITVYFCDPSLGYGCVIGSNAATPCIGGRLDGRSFSQRMLELCLS
jgi:hypothetical protein